jgi:outer membrane lipoprotein-sorting protein
MYWLAAAAVIFPKNNPAFDILDKIDQNMVYKTSYSEAEMIITVNNRKIKKEFISYSEGISKSYIEFLSPARDKGTKILRLDDIVKIYYPSAERIMRLSGHMLRRSMMGSDFSYEDMTERAKKMREEYLGEILGEEIYDNRLCHVLKLTSKAARQTYFSRKMWIDKERYVGLKEELYAKSGKLLKTMIVTELKTFKDRFYPTRLILEDQLRKNSKTEMIIHKIDFDIPIPPDLFTERGLLN